MQSLKRSLGWACEQTADYAGYLLAVAAAGYSLSFLAWALSHPALLPAFILENQIPPVARAALLRLLCFGMAATLAAWAVLGLALWRSGRAAARRLKRVAAAALGLSLLSVFPLLGLPGLPAQHPFLVFGLVAAMAALALLSVRLLVRLWQPASMAVPAETPALPAGTAGAAAPAGRYRMPLGPSLGLVAVLALVLGYTLFMSVLTVDRHNVFMTHSFDLGIHDQVVYNALHTGVLRSTQHGPQPINYLREHFAPILYVIAPLYALHQDARTLLVLQSLLLALGALPVYWLVRRRTSSVALALCLAAAYLLYPALQGVNTFDFHQIVPATPLLLFALYFLDSDRTPAFLACLGLALLAKEEVALTGMAIGLYAFWARRRYALGAGVALVCLLYFVAVVRFIMPALGGEAQINRFAGLMAPGSDGMGAVFKTLLTNPWYVAQFVLSNRDKLIYLAQLLLPVVGLPFLGGWGWLVAAPSLGLALLSSAETQYTVGYHYPAGAIPGLFFVAALGAARVSARRGLRLPVAAAVLIAALAMNYEYGWILGRNFDGFPQPNPHQRAVAQILASIPPEASVSTMSDLAPHVSNRRNVFLFPVVNDADYLVLDTDPSANFWPFEGASGRGSAQVEMAPYFLSGAYGVAEDRDGVVVLRRGQERSQNNAGLRTLFSARYEAEDRPGDFGLANEPDPGASGGAARIGRPDLPHEAGKTALTFGPYDTLWPGAYRVIFWLKLQGPASGKIGMLDVFSGSAGGPLAARDLQAADFRAGEGYQPFAVDVNIAQARQDVEYRVLYGGRGVLAVDYIQVTPVRVTLPDTGQVLEFGDNGS